MSLVLDEHRRYLADRTRLAAYERALREVIRPGDVVVDLASGTGILGLLACRAGASRVYAIEVGPLAELAREIARANGLGDRIHVVRGHSSDVTLPERGDVAVSDQIGRFGFEAGILSLATDARTRFLKPGARLVPSRVDLFVAPVEHRRGAARVAFWSRQPAGFEFAPAHRVGGNTGYPARFAASQLLSEPSRGASLDLTAASPSLVRIESTFTAARPGTLDGIGGWFASQLSPRVSVSNSPLDPARIIRRQAFFPLSSPVGVGSGDHIDLSLRILPDAMQVSWTVTVRPVAGEPVSSAQSTLDGMLLDPSLLRKTDPSSRPALTARGAARRTVLELCDGTRLLSEIEEEVFVRHRGLFTSAGDAATFVGEVVTRYSRDDG